MSEGQQRFKTRLDKDIKVQEETRLTRFRQGVEEKWKPHNIKGIVGQYKE